MGLWIVIGNQFQMERIAMDQGVVNQTTAAAEYEKRRKELSGYLQTIQEIYRADLSDAELAIWWGTLQDYPMTEIQSAMDNLMRHPPKFEITGEQQIWRGMPKLPDVLQKIFETREYRASMLKVNPPKY